MSGPRDDVPAPDARPEDGAADALTEERAQRGWTARRRADQAAERAAQLRERHAEALSGGAARGSSPAELAESRKHADAADASMVRAFERGAAAHDRAANLHERRVANDDGPPIGDTEPDHDVQARQHRAAAEADRELARQAVRRRLPDSP
jgi:hypothetical protein